MQAQHALCVHHDWHAACAWPGPLHSKLLQLCCTRLLLALAAVHNHNLLAAGRCRGAGQRAPRQAGCRHSTHCACIMIGMQRTPGQQTCTSELPRPCLQTVWLDSTSDTHLLVQLSRSRAHQRSRQMQGCGHTKRAREQGTRAAAAHALGCPALLDVASNPASSSRLQLRWRRPASSRAHSATGRCEGRSQTKPAREQGTGTAAAAH